MKGLRKAAPALVIFVVGAAFLVIGVLRGEAAIVLQKATTVCMECIGIG